MYRVNEGTFFLLVMRAVLIVFVLGNVGLLTIVSLPETVVFASGSSITGTDGFPDDVGTSHLGVFFPSPNGNPAGIWARPHIGPFIWGKVERAPGTYNWFGTDDMVRLNQRFRIAILATVFPYAGWDQEACHASRPRYHGEFSAELGDLIYSPCDMDAYAAWLGAMVERYDGDGIDDMPGLAYPVRHWEILNEPGLQDYPEEIAFFLEEPHVYLEILEQSYETIKTVDPNAVVLIGGQAGMNVSFAKYNRQVLQGAQGLFDLGNVHFIGPNPEVPTKNLYASEYRAFLDQLSYRNTSFWITEAIPGGQRQIFGGEISADELRREFFTSVTSAFGNGAEVLIFPFAGSPGMPQGMGAAHDETFALLAEYIGDFITAQHLAANAVRFDMPNGQKVYALWDNALLISWEFSGTAKVIPYLGEESEQDVNQIFAGVPLLAIVD